jgi:catechol 1,2-dioxygenase
MEDETMSQQERLSEIAGRIVDDVRTAITDLRITEDEIHLAADFFNGLGQAGEFPDLLDIYFGVTSTVATLGVPGGTTPNLAGPYYKGGAPFRDDGLLYEGELPEGETPLVVRGTVTYVDSGEPVPEAILDVWQANGNGDYDEGGYHLRGQVKVDADGSYAFRTVLPEGYQIPAKGPTTELLEALGQHNWRPAHIHLRVHVGETTPLQTQFFIGGARYLESDPVDAVREDLVIAVGDDEEGPGKTMEFPIRIADTAPGIRLTVDGPKALASARR